MKILNLGCGQTKRDNAINIDINPDYIPDMVMDMSSVPWVWETESMDGIYMEHFLEHTPDPKKILHECHRVLKKGGFLYITVPHSTSASGNGCIHHYQTFSYNTLKDYLDTQKKLFQTERQKIIYLPHYEWLPIQWLINLNPVIFERLWGYWVGGATEVLWEGLKI